MTDAILGRIGGPPPIVAGAPLTDIQQTYLRSYARSFSLGLLERRQVQAVVEAQEAAPDRRERLRTAADYWLSVQRYVAATLA